MRFLLFGSSGWIGSMVKIELEKNPDNEVICGKSRLENYNDLFLEINNCLPQRVINCAGITGRPNVDWCESNKLKTFEINVVGIANLAKCCEKLDIHITNLASGCIYEYDDKHLEKLDSFEVLPFFEEDEPNFTKSTYSISKILAEKILSTYNNILTLRLRMPITSDLCPRNFITKILNYEKVVNVQNSMSLIEELVPILVDMSRSKILGVYNFVNTGTISHNEILELYKKHVDNNFVWENFSVEEQSNILKAGRSNCYISNEKLLKLYPNISNIKEGVESLFLKL